jgi:hypothetical protein
MLIGVATDLAQKLMADRTFESRRFDRRQAVASTRDSAQLESEFARAIESNRELHSQAPLVALRHLIDSAGDGFAAAAKEAWRCPNLVHAWRTHQPFFLTNEPRSPHCRVESEIQSVGVAVPA